MVYGAWIGPRRAYFAVAATHALTALAPWPLRGYVELHRHVVGLDRLALGAAFFVLALAISFLKAGAVDFWRRGRKSEQTDQAPRLR